MSTVSDFCASYDYDGFFSGVSRQLVEEGIEHDYQIIDNRYLIECEFEVDETVVLVSVFDHPYNGIHISFELELSGGGLDERCNQLNLLSHHVVFNHIDEQFYGEVQIPVALGEGWDSLAQMEIVSAMHEIQRILDQIRI